MNTTPPLATATLILLALATASCSGYGDRYVADNSNQGNLTVRKVEGPPPPPPAQDTGPSEREKALQKRIDQLEAQQKATNDELDRLKAEKSKGQ